MNEMTTTRQEGRVACGGGFYVPPAGYTPTIRSDDMEEGQSMLSGTTMEDGCWQRCGERRGLQPAAVLVVAMLLGSMQAAQLAWYGHRSPVVVLLGTTSLVLNLYASVATMLVHTLQTVRPRYGWTQVLGSITASCGVLVCLGAALQLSALVAFAINAEQRVRYGVIAAAAVGITSTLVAVAYALLNSKERDPPRRQRSVSSHAGIHKPDYGLDSESDAEPKKDWTQSALEHLFGGCGSSR